MTERILKPVDVTVANHGTIFLFKPETDAAKAWIEEHVSADAQWFGKSLAVEHRYAENLAAGMLEAGLVVQ